MNKGVVRLLVKLFLVLLLPFEILNLIYSYVEFNFTDNGMTKFRKVPYGIQIANVGSSHGYNFDYSEFPEYKSFNFNLSMQATNYDYHILNQYIDHMEENSVMFLLVSFGEVEGIQPDFQYEKIKKRYYQFLKPSNIENYNFFDALKQRFFPIVCDSHPFKTIWDHFVPKKQDSAASKKQRTDEEFAASITKELVLHSFETMFPNMGEEGFDYNYGYLIKMIELCNAHKVYPVVVTCPVPDLTSEYYAETGFFDQYEIYRNKVLSETAERGLNCKWYDYSRSPDFCHNYSYFKDISHMSDSGAKVFTRDIIEKLKDEKILSEGSL